MSKTPFRPRLDVCTEDDDVAQALKRDSQQLGEYMRLVYGDLRRKGAVDPAELLKHRHGNQREIDRLVRKNVPDGMNIACRDRCAFCCYQHVIVGPIEIFGITRRYTLDRDKLRKSADAVAGLPHEERYKRRIPCPLLSEDGVFGRCTVYDERPGSCRMHYSVSREACVRDFDVGGTEEGVPIIATSHSFGLMVQYAVDLVLLEEGYQVFYLELAEGLWQGTREGCLDAWLAKERPFDTPPDDDYASVLEIFKRELNL